MEPSVRSLARLLDLNGDLFLNCLEGLSESDALARPLPRANSIAFVAAHMVDARHFMARILGQPIENPLAATLGAAKVIEDVIALPSVGELSAMWIAVASHVSRCLEATAADAMARPSEHPFPISDPTVLGALAFLVQHESYHVGQMAMLRKGLGYPAMSYERRHLVDGGNR